MEDKKRLRRFAAQLKARYSLKEGGRTWGECIIVDINRRGMGIEFHTQEKIDAGSTINLEIDISGKSEPLSIGGILKWMEGGGNIYFGGIELAEILDEIEWTNLIYYMS
ncbi:MAG: PilZ domain-containing protein [Thermodesulfobacteriota bacterium]